MLEWFQKLFSKESPPLKYRDLGNDRVEVSCGDRKITAICFSEAAVKHIEAAKKRILGKDV